MSKTQELYTYAKTKIPGGVQLLSKRPEQFAPDQWPAYFKKAKGCEVWDLDDKHYYDMSLNGVGSCILGYADPDVSKAVIDRINNGSMNTLNSPEEVELADKLLEIHPWADSVRYARTGGETCAIAVRIARATTKRDIVIICGYHGWCDWYLAANLGTEKALDGQLLPGLKPAGVTRTLKDTTFALNFGDKEGLAKILEEHGDNVACVIMEPFRNATPDPDFLNYVKESLHKVGALLILDEITIGWRYCFGGAHLAIGVNPDIAVFAKALGNGHPIGAVIGTKAAMDGAQESFISSTYWTEGVGPTAALATIKKIEETKAWEYVSRIGQNCMDKWNEYIEKYDIPAHAEGTPCLAHLAFTKYPLELKTLYTVKMLKYGFLGGLVFYPTTAHTDEIMELYYDAIDKVFAEIKEVLDKNDYQAILDAIGGPVCQSGFARLLK